MQAEFEEKQYEQHLNFELLKGANFLFPPGQVLEKTLGFDSALYTTHEGFWELFPLHLQWHCHKSGIEPGGIRLPVKLWENIEKYIEQLPKFKFNAFIQHKRPEYMKRRDAAEYASWGGPYYRYKLVLHQQEALAKISNAIGNNGVVVYACPAFFRVKELWDAVKDAKVVDSSNFCEVRLLNEHNVFTFQNSGNYGIAHSEPESIESGNIFKKFKRLSKKRASESNAKHLKDLGELLDSVCKETQMIKTQYENITNYMLRDIEQFPVAIALVKIDIFKFLTRAQIFIGF